MCNNTSSTKCSTCGARYYSRTCQKADWSVHKVLCKDFAALTPRQSSTDRLIILFPADDEQPQLLWTSKNFFPQGEKGDQFVGIFTNKSRNRVTSYRQNNPPYELALRFGANLTCIAAGSGNKSIDKVCASDKQRNGTPWVGPLVAMRMSTLPEGRDMGPMDFRDVVDFLRSYDPKDTKELPLANHAPLRTAYAAQAGGAEPDQVPSKWDLKFMNSHLHLLGLQPVVPAIE